MKADTAVCTSAPATGMHGDAHLVEAHQRTAADTVDDDGVDVVLGQQQDRRHAAAIRVRCVVKDLHLAHLAVDHVDHGEALTAAEVAGATGCKAAGCFGGDGDTCLCADLVAHVSLTLNCRFVGSSIYAWPPRKRR